MISCENPTSEKKTQLNKSFCLATKDNIPIKVQLYKPVADVLPTVTAKGVSGRCATKFSSCTLTSLARKSSHRLRENGSAPAASLTDPPPCCLLTLFFPFTILCRLTLVFSPLDP